MFKQGEVRRCKVLVRLKQAEVPTSVVSMSVPAAPSVTATASDTLGVTAHAADTPSELLTETEVRNFASDYQWSSVMHLHMADCKFNRTLRWYLWKKVRNQCLDLCSDTVHWRWRKRFGNVRSNI